ncbi:MAG: TolC family protein [Paludibacteraceae bacterium]
MKTHYMTIIFGIALAFSGCGIYGKYQRPTDLPLDNLYRDSVAVGDTASLAQLSWRDLFTDSILCRWIEYALQHNSDLQIARLKTDEAAASLMAAKLAYLPSAELSPQGTVNSFDGAEPAFTYSVGGSVSWEIDIFGSLTNQKRQAQAKLAGSDAYRQAVQTQLIATIADNYYALLMLDRQLAISRQTIQTWEQSLSVMQALYAAGETTAAAVAQTQAGKLNVEQSALKLEQQITVLENTFSTLVGITPQTISRGTYAALQLPEQWSPGVPLEMIARRPDVLQAECELAQAFYATNYARSHFYPKLTLSGSAGWTNNAGTMIVNPAAWLLNAVAGLVQPLFNNGKNVANLKVAKAQQQEALLAYRQKILDAGAEVNNALVGWQTALKNKALARQKIESLEAAVQNTQLLMQHGNTNYLEVLTAMQTLLDARLGEVSDQYDEIQSIISLYHALGGGCE